MGTNSNSKSIIKQTPPSIAGQAQQELRKFDFDAQVQLRGVSVYIDRAFECPCRGDSNNSPLPSCRNCAGSGWTWLNRYKTRLILQSMNSSVKYKEWSQERTGMVKITARKEEELAFMDKVTLVDGISTYQQVLHPKIVHNILRSRFLYEVLEVKEIFCFNGSDSPLKKLEENTDYSLSGNFIQFNQAYKDWEGFTVSVKYTHKPQYYVVDFNREVMVVDNLDRSTGYQKPVQMPVLAIGRRAHDVLDEQSFTGDYVLDNSYEENCKMNLPFIKPPLNINSQVLTRNVTLSWENFTGAEDIVVERSLGDDSHFLPFRIESAPTSQIIVAQPETYPVYYRFATRIGGSQSAWSSVIGVNIP